ncbi:MAG: Fic family protein [Thermoleophilia bacterium]
MDVALLRGSPLGELVPISGTDGRTGRDYDHFAFLPHPLPREVELPAATWTAVARAEADLARLDQAARQVPEPALLRQPALRREAQSTSALEGTFAPIETVLESDLERRGQLRMDVREILNYVAAAEEGFSWVAERPITLGLIRTLQRTLVEGTDSEHDDAGGLRSRQVFIGPRHAPLETARFVPPPPGDRLSAGMDAWIEWVDDPPRDMPAVLQAALAHYQFETLHPFSDGNGRIGRLLIVLQLIRRSVLTHPILVVSPWFEVRRDQYQDALLALSRTGRWSDWVEFFATGIAASARSTHERVDTLLTWRDDAIARVRAAGVSGLAERIAANLIGAPILTPGQAARANGVTAQGARNALRRLAELGIVTESNRNGRLVFHSDEVVDLIRR